uniref:Uncharacterized protein n=1 Tax=Anguilla anguilla TaxID=7936 RepID=A0A0E9SLF7_ANGAN
MQLTGRMQNDHCSVLYLLSFTVNNYGSSVLILLYHDCFV